MSTPQVSSKGMFYGTWDERKVARTYFFKKFIKGWKLRPCIACNGSGYYDSARHPRCGACAGTGKERYKPNH